MSIKACPLGNCQIVDPLLEDSVLQVLEWGLYSSETDGSCLQGGNREETCPASQNLSELDRVSPEKTEYLEKKEMFYLIFFFFFHFSLAGKYKNSVIRRLICKL